MEEDECRRFDDNANGCVDLNDKSLHLSRKYERKEIYCPFTWKECCNSLEKPYLTSRVNEKLRESDDTPWREFCYKILLICIHIKKKEDNEVETLLKSCSEVLRANKNESFIKDIFNGLLHVLLSCELFVYIEKKDNERARIIFSDIESFHVLNQECKAAVLAVKACILEVFGNNVLKEALNSIEEAIELDPDELGKRRGAWYCLAGKIHYSIRCSQSFNMVPSQKEISLLERSVEKDPFPINILYLADTYRHTAKMLLQRSFENNKEEANKFSEKAKRIYEKVISDENASISSLNRCGIGLIKLGKKFRNVELAEIAFDRVLKRDPNNRGSLTGMGNLMQWCKNDLGEALKYFEKASINHPVGKNIIQLKCLIDKDYCPLEDCDKYLEKEKDMFFKSEDSILFYHILKAEYLIMKNKDLIKALSCLEKALRSCANSKEIQEYKCQFANKNQSNILKIIEDEINLALNEELGKKEEDYLRDMLKLLRQ